ncbi:MAG: wax ester/triacylglycerol synthase family O-acyltransferase [Acidimicrobiales bacterium]
MERLSGLDAGFLYMETPTLLMHTLKLAILEPPVAVDALPLEWVRARIADRLHLLPPFRRRLVEVPFGLHHPLWIEDPDFDLEYHVRRVQVPPPGTPEQMDRVVAELASTARPAAAAVGLSVLNGLEAAHRRADQDPPRRCRRRGGGAPARQRHGDGRARLAGARPARHAVAPRTRADAVGAGARCVGRPGPTVAPPARPAAPHGGARGCARAPQAGTPVRTPVPMLSTPRTPSAPR